MNTQERALLTNLLNNLKETANGATNLAKDPEAAQMISETLTAAPDSAYLLVQRHLLLEMALERAQEQIKTLQSGASGSFLGGVSMSGSNPSSAQTNAYGQPIGRAEPTPTYAAPASAAAATARSSFGGGSFLGTAAATATGVLGGALLFQGIEHLMGGGMGGSTMAGNLPTEEVTNITENFYGSSPDMNTDLNTDLSSGGWDNAAMTNADGSSVFDDPAANPIDPTPFGNDGLFDQSDSGGGFFDGLFGGGDDDWV